MEKETLIGNSGVNSGASNSNKRKRSIGRQKIPMKRIEKKDALNVSFSKRRAGLFKKAYELSVLCGAEVAVLVFSPGGKPYSFIHPSSPSLLDRYVSAQSFFPQLPSHDVSTSDATTMANLNKQLAELNALVEAEKMRKEALKEKVRTLGGNICLDADVSRLGLAELEKVKMELERVQVDVLAHAEALHRIESSNLIYGYENIIPNDATHGYQFVSAYNCDYDHGYCRQAFF